MRSIHRTFARAPVLALLGLLAAGVRPAGTSDAAAAPAGATAGVDRQLLDLNAAIKAERARRKAVEELEMKLWRASEKARGQVERMDREEPTDKFLKKTFEDLPLEKPKLLGDGGRADTYLQLKSAVSAREGFDLRGMNLYAAQQFMRDAVIESVQTIREGNDLVRAEDADKMAVRCTSAAPPEVCPLYREFLPIRKMMEDCTVALVHRQKLEDHRDGTFTLNATTVRAKYDVCPDETHVDPGAASASVCSGVLVRKNRVLTARHCLKEFEGKVENIRIVRGYRNMQGERLPFNKGQVFSVRMVPANIHPEAMLLELVGEEIDVLSLPLPAPVPPAESSLVFAVGHPLGMPLTFSARGHVKGYPSQTIPTDLDVFQGNSGSPVFNSLGNLVGIVLEGANDFEYAECNHVKQCLERDRCRMEDVLSIDAVARALAR